jgi:carbon starvation protein
MAYIIHSALEGLGSSMSFWYHFAILFEALFILTKVDAGTRTARFMFQDLLGLVHPTLKKTESIPSNILATMLVVSGWGYFLYQGVIDPLGGIYTLWPLFGIANQMLAAIALMLCIVILFKVKKERFAWVAILPTTWLLVCTMSASWQKIFSSDPAIGFFAKAAQLKEIVASGSFVPNGTFETINDVHRVIFNQQLDGFLTAFFALVVLLIGFFTISTSLKAYQSKEPTTKEIPYEMMPENADDIVRGVIR